MCALSVPWPEATQASSPPASGRTRVKPSAASLAAALAAEASLGQLQYSTISTSGG